MTLYGDDFNRADTASGLGTIPGTAIAWELSGSWRILSQKPSTSTDRALRPAAVANVGGNDADITILANGGDAVYLRWVDSSNWVGARIRRYTETVTIGTEYEWEGDWQGFAPGALSQNGGSSHKHFDLKSKSWSTSNTSCPHAGHKTHTHDVWDPVVLVQNYTHDHARTACVLTGNTRPLTATVTRYQLIAEETVAGVVSTLGTVTIAAPSTLRARVQGSTLQAFVSGSTTPALERSTSAHPTAVRHGFGRGPSEVNASALDTVTLDSLNDAPYAPTLEFPVGVAVDRTADITFAWKFNDPNVGDSQSAFNFRTRFEGATSWQPVDSVVSPSSRYLRPGGTFPPGRWEWSVQTKDSGGRLGPWSTGAFFTAADPVTEHTITSPTAGQVIGTTERLVEWSTPDQAAYQLRVMSAESSGAVGTTVYYDSGVVANASARSALVPFPTNEIMVAIQYRPQSSEGLWAAYATSVHRVSWLGPRTPELRLDVDLPEGAMTVTAIDPAPFGDHPRVVDHVLERETATVVAGVPVFTGAWETLKLRPVQTFPENGSYVDYGFANGDHLRYRLTAVGANGTTTTGDPVVDQWIEPTDIPDAWPAFSEGFDTEPKNT